MISKDNFRNKLDEFIRIRELPKIIYSYLRDVGFENRPYNFFGFEEYGKILSYQDKIILVIREKLILLVDPIPYEKGVVEFIEFKIKEDVLDVIIGHISKYIA